MQFIEIPLTKCKIFLTEREIIGLLSKDIDLYKEGIQRGKSIFRSQKQKKREGKLFSMHEASKLKDI